MSCCPECDSSGISGAVLFPDYDVEGWVTDLDCCHWAVLELGVTVAGTGDEDRMMAVGCVSSVT